MYVNVVTSEPPAVTLCNAQPIFIHLKATWERTMEIYYFTGFYALELSISHFAPRYGNILYMLNL